jgi:hypothetical protein
MLLYTTKYLQVYSDVSSCCYLSAGILLYGLQKTRACRELLSLEIAGVVARGEAGCRTKGLGVCGVKCKS